MRHRNDHRKLSRTSAHRKALFSNLANALIEHERIITTDAKAKELRRVAEKLVTIAKHGRADATKDVASRRQALSVLRNRSNIDRLFGTLAERYATRNGGYTRILKYGRRAGDNAPLSIIEFVDRPAAPAQTEG
jgi:large subunit ribosomal protein L17